MAARIRRPQYLLPWIASCTLVLGAGLHLLAQSGRRNAAPNHRFDLTESREERARPLPARLDPDGRGLMVRGASDVERAEVRALDQNPALLDESMPGGVPMSEAELSATQLAARSGIAAESGAPREVEQSEKPLPPAGPKRPSRSGNAVAAEPESALERLLPAVGAYLSVFWVVPDASLDPDADAGAGSPVELRITRLDEDSYGAVLVLQDVAEAPDALSDPDRESLTQHPGSEAENVGAEPRERDSQRERWTRWFASQVPPGRQTAAPQTHAELRDRLEGVLGERKTDYLAAATRELDAQEAAQLLGQARRWALEQRRP